MDGKIHIAPYASAPIGFLCGQESRNSLAPMTVKLGSYSKWNWSRDFAKAVKQPLDMVLAKLFSLLSDNKVAS